ncbi:hypothetical protein CAMRE0001_0801 [Campylobacter rectus RM3267]|uniref:Uncharacterized protein n=1 Tax=Campylobacter rectus RM3267 TaxID=553218 RepID=B9CZV5_CAMRE|nr:hypothetical protein CAMRE0001_0801 [Campylobacter rectus RM3267]
MNLGINFNQSGSNFAAQSNSRNLLEFREKKQIWSLIGD